MNNKPTYLLNWLANIGLCDNLNSTAPGALDILQRSANDLVSIIETLSKVTETEQTDGLKNFLEEIKIATTYLTPLMDRVKTKRQPGENYFNTFAHGVGNTVQTVEETWALGASTQPPPYNPSLEAFADLTRGKAFGVLSLPQSKGVAVENHPIPTEPVDSEVAESKGEGELDSAVQESIVDTPALTGGGAYKQGIPLLIKQDSRRAHYIAGLSTTAIHHPQPIMGFEEKHSKFTISYRNPSDGSVINSKKIGKLELLEILSKHAFIPNSSVLANYCRRIQNAITAGAAYSMTIHELGGVDILVFLNLGDKSVITFITTVDKLNAYLPAAARV